MLPARVRRNLVHSGKCFDDPGKMAATEDGTGSDKENADNLEESGGTDETRNLEESAENEEEVSATVMSK